jgi:hypothetical protein
MSSFDNVWRLSTSQALAVASVGGAAASSSAFGTQTYAIQLSYPGSTSSTGGCRIAIVSPNDNAVSSTAGTLLPPNWIDVFRCTPASVSLPSRMMRVRSHCPSLS